MLRNVLFDKLIICSECASNGLLTWLVGLNFWRFICRNDCRNDYNTAYFYLFFSLCLAFIFILEAWAMFLEFSCTQDWLLLNCYC